MGQVSVCLWRAEAQETDLHPSLSFACSALQCCKFLVSDLLSLFSCIILKRLRMKIKTKSLTSHLEVTKYRIGTSTKPKSSSSSSSSSSLPQIFRRLVLFPVSLATNLLNYYAHMSTSEERLCNFLTIQFSQVFPVSKHHVMKACRIRGGTFPFIL